MSEREHEPGLVTGGLHLPCFPACYIALGDVRAAVDGMVFRADPCVIQVRPHRIGEIHPGQALLHQPAAQLLIRGDILDEFIPVQAGSHPQDVIQALDLFHIQRADAGGTAGSSFDPPPRPDG